MARNRYSKKEVETVLQELEGHGWTIEQRGGGHAWGLLRRPKNSRECRCGKFGQMSINSTPENPGNHAAKLRGKAFACIFFKDEDNG